MKISRRDFLKFCGVSAAALGLTALDLARLREVLANPDGPAVHLAAGAGCTGCTESFLNRISSSPTEPQTAAEVLIDSINLSYHPTLMALAGESAAAQAERAFQAGNYLSRWKEGCRHGSRETPAWLGPSTELEANFLEAVTALSTRAAAILCVGTCASWGGVAAAPPNPTAVKGVGDATGRPSDQRSGMSPPPGGWIVWTMVQAPSRGKPRSWTAMAARGNSSARTFAASAPGRAPWTRTTSEVVASRAPFLGHWPQRSLLKSSRGRP